MVVDGQCSDYKNIISGIPQGSVLGPLLRILYTSDIWSGLENRLVAYADDATLFASVPSPHMRPIIAESLNRDLAKISALCKLWGMKMNPNKTQCTTVSRSRTAFLPHPDLFVDNVPLTLYRASNKKRSLRPENEFFFKELKVQIQTYELRGHGKKKKKKKSTMGSHTTP